MTKPNAERELFKRAGCGAVSPDGVKPCDCVTGVGYRGTPGDFEHCVFRESLAEQQQSPRYIAVIADDGRLKYKFMVMDNRETMFICCTDDLTKGENIALALNRAALDKPKMLGEEEIAKVLQDTAARIHPYWPKADFKLYAQVAIAAMRGATEEK